MTNTQIKYLKIVASCFLRHVEFIEFFKIPNELHKFDAKPDNMLHGDT